MIIGLKQRDVRVPIVGEKTLRSWGVGRALDENPGRCISCQAHIETNALCISENSEILQDVSRTSVKLGSPSKNCGMRTIVVEVRARPTRILLTHFTWLIPMSSSILFFRDYFLARATSAF